MLLNRVSKPVGLLALALLASWPLLHSGPPNIVDAPNHYYRLVELAWHVRHWDLYPRWFSDINHGYGGPLFNFYAPLSYYAPLILHLLGLALPQAFLGGFVLAVFAAVLGMYGWSEAQFNSMTAGMLAASAYVLSPYLFYNLLIRGALPEVWGLALAPWLFWAGRQAVVQSGRRSSVLLALGYAALILTHSLSALLFSPLLLLYVACLTGLPTRTSIGRWLGLAAALALGAGLAAFFLLPFFVENGYITLSRASLDYKAFFISISDLLSLPVPFDPLLARNAYPLSLPLPTLVLALLGLAFVWRQQPPSPWRICAGVFACGLGAYASASLSASAPLWSLLPLGRLVQFPWRMIGPATLLAAWLAGAAAWRWRSKLLTGVAIGIVFFYTFTWTLAPQADRQYPASGMPADVIQYEISAPVAVGLTYQQEFLPIWMPQPPSPGELSDRYRTDPIPSRIGGVPAGLTVLKETNFLTGFEIKYQATRADALSLDLTYFPGWAATLDGLPIEVRPDALQGLVTLDLPAGSHTLKVALRPTAAQATGTSVSLMAILVLIFLWISGAHSSSTPEPTPRIRRDVDWGWGILFIGLIAIRLLLQDRVDTPFVRTQVGAVPNPPGESVSFGGQLALIGLDLTGTQEAHADQPVEVALYWQALMPMREDYHVSIQLTDDFGNRFGQSDQYPGLLPTSGWGTGLYARDEHIWTALEGTPPGRYHLMASVYAIREGAARPLDLVRNGVAAGLEYDIGTISLGEGWLGHSGPMKIVEAAPASRSVSVGDALAFSLAWQTGPAPQPGIQAEITLKDQRGRQVFSTRFAPAGTAYPSADWRPARLVRYPQSIVLPPDVPAGSLNASVRLVDATGAAVAGPFQMGSIVVSIPLRTFTAPAMAVHVNHDFGAAARLLGYTNNATALTLYWQALKPLAIRYTVYVHNLDASGRLISGHDSAPERATTSWLPGEIISDVRPPLASDRFEIGLYDPVSGERLGDPLRMTP
jgi:hypothetical protein